MWRHTSITTWIFLWVLYTRSSHYWLIIHEKLLNLPWVRLFWQCRLFEKKKINMQDIGPAPNNFLQDLLKLCRTWIFPWRKSFEEVKILRLFFRTGIYKILNLNGIGDGNNKNPTHHVFKYKHTKWSHWCITASLNYKNTMINRITMETVACLRSKFHLKQNLIPSWPWSFRHTWVAFPISGAKQNTQTKHFVGHPDRLTWQYCRSLWFSACSVQRISKSLTVRYFWLFILLWNIVVQNLWFEEMLTYMILENLNTGQPLFQIHFYRSLNIHCLQMHPIHNSLKSTI
jgi:hypothetical protein